MNNFINYEAFQTVQFKIKATKLQKKLYFALLDNYFTNIFSESKFGIERQLILVQNIFQKVKVNSSENINKDIKTKLNFWKQSWKQHFKVF